MTRALSKDTLLCMSLAGRPSNIGTRFHNYLYDELDLDYVYKAFTTTDIGAAVAGIRALGIRGCSVSMPYKETCIEHLDGLDASAEPIASVNTIVNEAGQLRGFNTDYLAVGELLDEHEVGTDLSFCVLGSGGMAKAVLAALRDHGFRDGVVVARNVQRGQALAGQYGYAWQPQVGSSRPRLLVNATPIGMTGSPDADVVPVEVAVVEACDVVFDVVAFPAQTPLIHLARRVGKPVISGTEVIAVQAAEQFVLYTGVRPSAEQVRRASAFSREPA
ncbi:MAG: shikimate 5-dehydrogenase [Propionibacteriales bacterium]|nr:shikimate 5-dehydrogenase [Propionibacteriales bacterium]